MAILATTFLISCEDGQENTKQLNDEAIEAAENEAAIEELTDEIDEITYFGSAAFFDNGRTAAGMDEQNPVFCAIRTFDEENKTIIIDFGDGCNDWRGRHRQGKVIINYTDHLFVPGAILTITFENFYFRGVKIDGKRIITNISESLEDNLLFDITFEGEFTWPDETVGTRRAHWVVERIRASNPINDEKHVNGSASGTTRNGVDYNVDITETIVFKRSCGPFYVFIPVQGVKVISHGDREKIIDYGNGECDRFVTVTTDGFSQETELRRRFQRHQTE